MLLSWRASCVYLFPTSGSVASSGWALSSPGENTSRPGCFWKCENNSFPQCLWWQSNNAFYFPVAAVPVIAVCEEFCFNFRWKALQCTIHAIVCTVWQIAFTLVTQHDVHTVLVHKLITHTHQLKQKTFNTLQYSARLQICLYIFCRGCLLCGSDFLIVLALMGEQ